MSVDPTNKPESEATPQSIDKEVAAKPSPAKVEPSADESQVKDIEADKSKKIQKLIDDSHANTQKKRSLRGYAAGAFMAVCGGLVGLTVGVQLSDADRNAVKNFPSDVVNHDWAGDINGIVRYVQGGLFANMGYMPIPTYQVTADETGAYMQPDKSSYNSGALKKGMCLDVKDPQVLADGAQIAFSKISIKSNAGHLVERYVESKDIAPAPSGACPK